MSFLRVASRNITGSARRYSTIPPPPAKSSNLPLLLGVGGLLGIGAYIYADKTEAKPKKPLVSALDKDNFKEFAVKKVEPYNHNTAKFTLELPPGEATLLPVSGLVYVKASESDPNAPRDQKGNTIGRPYTPVSDPEKEGEVTFVIKRYDTGKLTPYIHNLKPGDKVSVKGPIVKRPWKNNEFEEEEFEQLKAKHGDRFDIVYIVDKGDKNWSGLTGFITKDILKKEIAPASLGNKVMVYVCGPPAQVDAIAGKKDGMKQGALGGALKELGYTSEQVFKF
ncbi:NADH-cytochrome b5 reductase [Ceratobasidium sp. 423]|nr:NADH-cytochrome b5 reductase [Ceratobasidium sp. 423]